MEGPSLFLAQEQLVDFKGKKVLVVTGNTKIGKEQFLGKDVIDIFSWGKHLVFQFDTVAFRVHFLLFGTFEATVNGISITGDYKRAREPRLALTFENGEIKLFNCSIKVFDDPELKNTYDFSIDIMSSKWDSIKAVINIQQYPEEEIADVLLDQTLFSGVGNIIKNEVLSLVKINPKTAIKHLSQAKISEVVAQTHEYSHQFYLWRKEFLLLKNLKVHRKKLCPHCGGKIVREKTGERQRWSYYCLVCQQLL